MLRHLLPALLLLTPAAAQTLIHFDHPLPADVSLTAPIYLPPGTPTSVRTAADAFAADVALVTGTRPPVLTALPSPRPATLTIVTVLHHAPDLAPLTSRLDLTSIDGKWESALTAVVDNPLPGVHRALVIAASDRRGAAFALFALSRQMGVSPWSWWADVPIPHHANVFASTPTPTLLPTPSVQYRGIFLNDEDWGLRPWAAAKMDPQLHNIGPHTYARIFELLLRLHANTLWPAMHPGSLAFNAVPENARLADSWGIVMGSSHSEALLRNNVGEWDEKRDGPWNFQLNAPAMKSYWDKRLAENGRFENFYTVGLRGVHDSGLEATGTPEVKARLVEEVMQAQRELLSKHVSPDLPSVPQIIWLYKESLDLYRVGMQVPPDVTLGWTDDNYGYIRQLPTPAEQARPGGSGLYYHVSYWGSPHDYLWLCTTPPALLREELTKAFDHNVRRAWILNVGDLKPAEIDIDYFMQLAANEPATANLDQQAFLQQWFAAQFPPDLAPAITSLMTRFYQLSFVRKAEFMGFNGYNDATKPTAFNPLAYDDQNRTRAEAWTTLAAETSTLAARLPAPFRDAFFELVAYPIYASTTQNIKFLANDRATLETSRGNAAASKAASAQSRTAFDQIQSLTAQYNALAGGKWQDIMSADPRNRAAFKLPAPLPTIPPSWAPGTDPAISLNAAAFTRKHDSGNLHWRILPDLGISGPSITFGSPGLLANSAPLADLPWLEYTFTSATPGPATLTLHLLPTFPVDASHALSFDVSLDTQPPVTIDASGRTRTGPRTTSPWADNVLRNDALATLPLGPLTPGPHTLRLTPHDPGLVFQHLVISFPNTPPAYPVPPTTPPHQAFAPSNP